MSLSDGKCGELILFVRRSSVVDVAIFTVTPQIVAKYFVLRLQKARNRLWIKRRLESYTFRAGRSMTSSTKSLLLGIEGNLCECGSENKEIAIPEHPAFPGK